MSARRNSYTNPSAEEEKGEREKQHYSSIKSKLKPHLIKHPLSLLASLSICLLLLFSVFPPPNHNHNSRKFKAQYSSSSSASTPTCHSSASVYVYDLPSEFNLGLLKDCRRLNVYTDMCPHVANSGLGQPLLLPSSSFFSSSSPHEGPSWFATHQFIAEMIFHARLENHPCRTRDPARANLFYVPFYGGLHASSKFREPDLTARDALAVRLAEYVRQQPMWRRHYGRDHFIAVGRTAWDFMRASSGGQDFGANRLLSLPAVLNVSVLTVERNPWEGSNQHGIPYPSYFHPWTADEMSTWQDRARSAHRPHLFSFIGAPRKGVEKAAVRDAIITQCTESTRCELVECTNNNSKCYEAAEVLGVMMASKFCLQAPGDSFTRRSTFDSVLAGCVPVFFSRHTAYTQYEWFLPREASSYSVYIGEEDGDGGGGGGKKGIEEELMRIPTEEVERMRKTVIDLIPQLTYGHPNATCLGFRDAVDVTLAALSNHVASILQ